MGNPLNYMELIGNTLVLLVILETFRGLTWVMVLNVMLSAVMNLRIFSQLRTLIQLIIESIKGMVTFLIIVAMFTFTFSLVNYET